MNPLDRIVLFFSPEGGERRLRARTRVSQLMNYDAASRGRRTFGWKAPGTAADAAAYGSRARLRNLSRDMIRNRPYAARAKEVVVANVVGTGVVPSVKAGDDRSKKLAQRVVDEFMLTPSVDAYGEADLYDLQMIVMGTVFADGEILARRRMRDPRYEPGLLLPFQIELLEADQLDLTITSYGQNQVIEGIEYSPIGAVEAYHILSEHPGAVQKLMKRVSTRVHWKDIIHVRRFDRPGQIRGVPWLAPVMMTLGELSDYQEAQILKQKMSALLAGIVTGVSPPEGSKVLSDLAPGALAFAPEDASVEWTQPPVVDGYDDFMRRNLASVAVGVGITYEALSGDLKGVNFSSGRMGRMEMDRLIKKWQSSLMIGQFCRGVERWVREAMALSPDFRAAKDFSFDWTAPRRILVDPTKEIPAMIEEMNAGLSSRQRQQRELGYDPGVIRRERAEDAEGDRLANAAAGPSGSPAPKAKKSKDGGVNEGGQ